MAAAGRSLPATARDAVSAALEVYGGRASLHVEGPISWLAWDAARAELTAVRDRLGLEPLYYAENGRQLAVGPLPAEVLRALGLPRRYELTSLVCHLNCQAPLPGTSFLAGVQAVEPGTAVRFALGGTTTQRFWSLAEVLDSPPAADRENVEELRALLIEVGQRHSVDTPAAISMSAGLDSTSVAAALRAARPEADLTALHRCAPEIPEADESDLARAVANHLDLRLETVRADLHWPLSSPQGFFSGAEGTPVCPPYAEAWEATWRRAHELGIDTVHTGAAGDQLFGCVVFPYADLLLRGRWRRLAMELRRHAERRGRSALGLLPRVLLRPLLRAGLPRWRPSKRSAVPWIGRVARQRWRQIHGDVLRWDRVYTKRVLPSRRDRLRFLLDARTPAVVAALGRSASRYGIELRHPLLDPKLFAFALSLPAEQCYSGGEDKVILRRAMQGHLPAEVLSGRDKVVPFSIFHRGLRERETEAVRHLITDMRCAEVGLVDEARLTAAYDGYLRGESLSSSRLWSVLTLEEWLRAYF